MKPRKSDIKRISSRTCEIKGCKNKSFWLFQKKFLCEDHFRIKKPLKVRDYRDYRKLKSASTIE